ncbi:MAG: lipoyl synthase [Acidimicrobiales bacterium]
MADHVTQANTNGGAANEPLHVRWLGRVGYDEAYALQQQLQRGDRNHLLLLEHPPVFTLGRSADAANILVTPDDFGAIVRYVDRGGDVTVHAPGQLVGYPILTVPGRSGLADTAKFVAAIEDLLIDVLADLGLPGASRYPGYTGVWLDADEPSARKIAAIGVRIKRNRSLHGFALNVDIDQDWFDRLVPCGITDKAVTSLRAEGITATMRDVVDAVAARAGGRWETGVIDRADVVWRHVPEDLSAFSRGEGPGDTPRLEQSPALKLAGTPVRLLGRLADAGVDESLDVTAPKPEWMRVKANMGPEYIRLKSIMRELELVTVCEEAGCPNIFECWNDGTATFMINGERCTRACGFCLVDTQKPEPLDTDEPRRVAEAVEKLGLEYAVITTVARDDLPDDGASGFTHTVAAIRDRVPHCKVELLISDCKGHQSSLDEIFATRPEVLNHNIESVARLQRAVRPSAGYARSLSVLAQASAAGLTTKSSIIVGMGETFDEVVGTLADLAGIGVNIVTIGQYLRPTTNHLPIHRWWTPDQFAELKRIGEAMGIDHVESSPLTRSSYHARQAEAAAT